MITLADIPGEFPLRVPEATAPHVRSFCKRLVEDCVPARLAPEPPPGARIQDCFEVVRARVASSGGDMVCGWLIVEWPRVMLEAVYHAVWRDELGSLHDISPQGLTLDETLFVPDPTREYDGRQVDSVRHALTNDPAVRRLIRAQERYFELTNRGDLATQHGMIPVSAPELEAVQTDIGESFLFVRASLGGRHDPCPCGSQRKYIKCHGKRRQ